MSTFTFGRRAALLTALSTLTFGILGSSCDIAFPPLPEPEPDIITVELVNETGFDVDPGLFVLDSAIDVGLVGPGEIPSYDIDCFEGDTVGVDAALLVGPDDVLSLTVPELEEGLHYLCGDLITFFFTQSNHGTFYSQAAVNDTLVAETVIVEFVNDTGFDVDPGFTVLDEPLDTGLVGADEVLPFELECFEGDTMAVDGILILGPGNEVMSLNAPELVEGVDYLCGDLVTFIFAQDNNGTFFVDVSVNDEPLP